MSSTIMITTKLEWLKTGSAGWWNFDSPSQLLGEVSNYKQSIHCKETDSLLKPVQGHRKNWLTSQNIITHIP